MFVAALSSLSLVAGCPAHTDALEAAAAAVEQRYVDAGQGRAIAEDLRRWASEGRYPQACGEVADFLSRVNRDLDGHDPHFFMESRAEGAEDAADDWLSAWRAEWRTVNAGVREARVLEGNIGYIRISSWYPWDLARPKLEAALALTRDVDGLIIDVRGNGGGDALTVEHLVRALTDPQVSAVQAIQRRDGREVTPLPALELRQVDPALPLAIIVDRRSGSASEYLAYSLQALGRAEVIGSRSGGVASIIGEPRPLTGGFALAIPEARPVNLITESNWEGSGVRPDVPGGDDPVHVARRRLER